MDHSYLMNEFTVSVGKLKDRPSAGAVKVAEVFFIYLWIGQQKQLACKSQA